MRYLRYFAAFLVIGLLLYSPIFSAGFAGDDYIYLVRQPYLAHVHTPLDLFRSVIVASPAHNYFLGYYYRPLPFLVYTALLQGTNANPFYFHLLQVFLFIGVVCILFLFFTTFFSTRIAFLLTLIFLIHPANDELGSYIAVLHDTFSLFFGLLALTVLAKTKHPSAKTMLIISICLICSLFAKESGTIFVLLTGIYASTKNHLKSYLLPLMILVCFYLTCRIFASQHALFAVLPSPATQYSFTQHVLLIPQLAYAIIREIIVPTRAAIQPHAFNPTLLQSIFPMVIVTICFSLLLGFGIWLKRQKKQYGKSLLLFSSFLFFGIVSYVQIIPLDVMFAERFLYIALIGMLGIFGIGVSVIHVKVNKWIIICLVLFSILLCSYAIETVILNFMWHNWQQYFT